MKKPTEFIFNDKLFSIIFIGLVVIVFFAVFKIYNLTVDFEKKTNEIVQKQKILIIDDYGNTYLTSLIKEKPVFIQKFALDIFYRLFYLNKDYLKNNIDFAFKFLDKKSAQIYQNSVKQLINEVSYIGSIYKPEILYFSYENNTIYIIFKYHHIAQDKISVLPSYFLVKFNIVDGKVTPYNNIGIYITGLNIYVIKADKEIKMYQLIRKVKGL